MPTWDGGEDNQTYAFLPRCQAMPISERASLVCRTLRSFCATILARPMSIIETCSEARRTPDATADHTPAERRLGDFLAIWPDSRQVL